MTWTPTFSKAGFWFYLNFYLKLGTFNQQIQKMLSELSCGSILVNVLVVSNTFLFFGNFGKLSYIFLESWPWGLIYYILISKLLIPTLVQFWKLYLMVNFLEKLSDNFPKFTKKRSLTLPGNLPKMKPQLNSESIFWICWLNAPNLNKNF